jgi:hypothetical protein
VTSRTTVAGDGVERDPGEALPAEIPGRLDARLEAWKLCILFVDRGIPGENLPPSVLRTFAGLGLGIHIDPPAHASRAAMGLHDDRIAVGHGDEFLYDGHAGHTSLSIGNGVVETETTIVVSSDRDGRKVHVGCG